MPQLNLQTVLIVLLVIVGGGWLIDHGRLYAELQKQIASSADDLRRVADTALIAQTALQKQRDDDAAMLHALELKYLGEVTNAKTANDALQRDISSGARRVYVTAKCPAGSGQLSNSGADTASAVAETRAELSPSIGSDIYGIAIDGDGAIGQLNTLIDACVKRR